MRKVVVAVGIIFILGLFVTGSCRSCVGCIGRGAKYGYKHKRKKRKKRILKKIYKKLKHRR